MVRGIEAAARADEHIVAGLHVAAEADINILLCADIFPDPMHDFSEDGLASCKVGRFHLIEFVTQIEAAEIVLVAAGKRRVIHQPELALHYKTYPNTQTQYQFSFPDGRPMPSKQIDDILCKWVYQCLIYHMDISSAIAEPNRELTELLT